MTIVDHQSQSTIFSAPNFRQMAFGRHNCESTCGATLLTKRVDIPICATYHRRELWRAPVIQLLGGVELWTV